MAAVYEHEEGHELGPDDEDGCFDMIREAEDAGWEGEHVWDAAVEDPPHPYWKDMK